MKRRLLDLLACPACGATLSADEPAERLRDGTLWCEAGHEWPVRDGIPRLVAGVTGEESRTAEQFKIEFSSFVDPLSAEIVPRAVEEASFYLRTGLDPTIYHVVGADPYVFDLPSDYEPNRGALAHKVVLDAGSGGGRYTRVAAETADYVVGMDLGEHVDWAARYCSDLDNVDFVQGSVLAPPFRSDAFDFVFSLGVIHHTPDPAGACTALGRLARNGIAIRVYPPEYWGISPKRPIARAIHRHVSRLEPQAALSFCRRWLYPLGRVQARLARRRSTKLLAAPLFIVNVPRHEDPRVMLANIYDYYAPSFVSTHRPEEVEGWLADAGFGDVRRLPVRSACVAERRSQSRARLVR